MAIQLDGKPIKLSIQFNSREAEQSLDAFLAKLKRVNTEGFDTLRSGASQSLEVLAHVSKDLYTILEMQGDPTPERRNLFADSDKKSLQEALKQAETYEEAKLRIKEKYAKAEELLGGKLTDEQKKRLDSALEAEISAITMAELKKVDKWENTFKTLKNLSKAAVNDALNKIKAGLDKRNEEGSLTKGEYEKANLEITTASNEVNSSKSWFASIDAFKKYKELLKKHPEEVDKIKEAQTLMFTKLASDLQSVSGIVSGLGGLTGAFGGSEELQGTIKKVGALVGGMGELATGIASGDPIKIISSSIKLLTAAVDLFNTKDKRLEKQIKGYKEQLASLGQSYQTLQSQIKNSVGESIYTDSKSAVENLKQQQELLAQSAKAEESKKKSDKNKIKGYNDEIFKLDQQIAEINKAVTQSLVQTSFKSLSDDLANAFTTAFEAGESGVEKVDKVFDQFIKKALVNSLKLKMIEPIMNDMVNSVSAYMLENDNSLVGFEFGEWRDRLKVASGQFESALGMAYEDLGLATDKTGTSAKTAASTGISSITESTANRLEAEFGGLRLAQIELLQVTVAYSMEHTRLANGRLSELIAIQNNTFRTANNTDRLVAIESALVSMNNKMTNTDALRRGAGI